MVLSIDRGRSRAFRRRGTRTVLGMRREADRLLIKQRVGGLREHLEHRQAFARLFGVRVDVLPLRCFKSKTTSRE